MINIKNPIYNTLAVKVGSYYPYINFNMYYSLIPQPSVKLITEVIYLDDIEREKFANSKLSNFDRYKHVYCTPALIGARTAVRILYTSVVDTF